VRNTSQAWLGRICGTIRVESSQQIEESEHFKIWEDFSIAYLSSMCIQEVHNKIEEYNISVIFQNAALLE